jgi:hypothetical protein
MDDYATVAGLSVNLFEIYRFDFLLHDSAMQAFRLERTQSTSPNLLEILNHTFDHARLTRGVDLPERLHACIASSPMSGPLRLLEVFDGRLQRREPIC